MEEDYDFDRISSSKSASAVSSPAQPSFAELAKRPARAPRSPVPVTAAPPRSAVRVPNPVSLPVSAALVKPPHETFTSVTASAPGAASMKPVPEKAPNKAENGDGFVTVQRRKRRLRLNQNRCGKAQTEADVTLRAAKPNTPVYISRLHYTTKAEDIVEYVRQKTKYTPRVQLLESRRNVNFKAFVVRVLKCFLPFVMDEDFWPQDVVFRRFRGQVPQESAKTI